MTTTPFEERPDLTTDAGTAADPGAQQPGDGADTADRDLGPADAPPEELMPDRTPFRTPGDTTD